MNKLKSICFSIVLLFSYLSAIYCQTYQINSIGFDNKFRQLQLDGQFDSSYSFAVRPFTYDFLDTSKDKNLKNFEIKILPITWKQQYNSDRPEGVNDGSMIPSRGYQSFLSGGFFAKFRNVSLQINPEYVFAQNREFQGFYESQNNQYWSTYYNDIVSRVDLPERFGLIPYSRFFWGNSSIRLNFSPFSLGISNENLWWGPGIHNSLLMTNNSSGFKHITFNTTKPIKTAIGSFEGQIIGGRLDASGFYSYDSLQLQNHGVDYIAKSKDWRYINGMVFVYQPKWIPGLFIGGTRNFISYSKELGENIRNFIPIFDPFLKQDVGNSVEDAINRNQLASVFMRWLAIGSNMEVYLEYGREDHNYDLTDLLLEPDHFRAYIVGLRKLTPINAKKNEFIDVSAELTQIGKNTSSSIRNNTAIGWYVHGLVREGYTNNGQYLGSAIGTSSNMQLLNISWTRNMKRIGFEFKRLVHEENFWAKEVKDYRKHWVDISGGALIEWDYKNLLINAKLTSIGSINYQWLYAPIPSDPPQWWDHGPILYNVHAELGITYLFNR